MNIKSKQLMHELADKCKSQYVNHNGPWMDYILFAELIVKECCGIMEEHGYRPAGVVKRNVKQQFGIEE